MAWKPISNPVLQGQYAKQFQEIVKQGNNTIPSDEKMKHLKSVYDKVMSNSK